MGAVVATALLCSAAATTGVWSGALASASGALHTSAAASAPAQGHIHHGTVPGSGRSLS